MKVKVIESQFFSGWHSWHHVKTHEGLWTPVTDKAWVLVTLNRSDVNNHTAEYTTFFVNIDTGIAVSIPFDNLWDTHLFEPYNKELTLTFPSNQEAK